MLCKIVKPHHNLSRNGHIEWPGLHKIAFVASSNHRTLQNINSGVWKLERVDKGGVGCAIFFQNRMPKEESRESGEMLCRIAPVMPHCNTFAHIPGQHTCRHPRSLNPKLRKRPGVGCPSFFSDPPVLAGSRCEAELRQHFNKCHAKHISIGRGHTELIHVWWPATSPTL
jgi:hypothetical protein